MIGAIIGDIVGSVYEWHNIKTKQFPFFQDKCFFTDDTVMTIAVAEGLMNGGERDDFIGAMKKYGRMYPDAGYGGRFRGWLFSEDRQPYNSWGNGSAMRTAAVGWYFDSLVETRRMSALASGVTHDHPEGIKGAESTAAAIFLARTGHSKAEIKDYVEWEFGYDLSRMLDEIRPSYRFNESCQDTVPQAITAFLESTDFEDAIRNAISLGGDSDTLAAITGGIAEAAYDVPQELQDKAWEYLDEPLRAVLRRWKRKMPRHSQRIRDRLNE